MKQILTLIFTIGILLSGYSQSRNITGKVTDVKGIGMPGVTVVVPGTTTGTLTDLDGNYKLNVAGNALRFTFIGFVAQEITIGNQSIINVIMNEEAQNLEQVVVVGYGTQKKKDITTAVAVVDAKELKDRPIVSAAQAMQGKAAGVQVFSPSGKPGAAMSVKVRGASSVLAGNDPLYVVDGVWTNDISSVNPNDIQSMSILKDASASAIYGASGANGVVIITTKRGSDDKPKVTFNSYLGISRLRKTIQTLSTKQYRDLMAEIGIPLSPTATDYTDWSDKVFGTGINHSTQFSVSGGESKFRYFLSGGYQSDHGIVKPARFDRYTFRLNLDNEIRPWLKLTTNLNVVSKRTKDTPDNASSGRGGVIMSTLNTPPFLHTYMNEGSPNFELTPRTWYDPNPFQPSWENPIAYMEGPEQEAVDKDVVGYFSADASITPDLHYRSSLGITLLSHQWDYYLDPFRTAFGRKENGRGESDKSNTSLLQIENIITYSKIVGKHKVNVILGNSLFMSDYKRSYLNGSDFPADETVQTLGAANIISGYSSHNEEHSASFFGNITYDYENKYYITTSGRYDGSSKLSNPWDILPSFSLGWRISAENFMKDIKFIKDLKLRGGYGQVGNKEGLQNYTGYGVWSYVRRTPTNPLSGPGIYLSSYGNPDLRWEKTTQFNLGFDLSVLNGRLITNFDIYEKTTDGLLLNVQLGSSLAINQIMTNAGKVRNRGLEFNITSVNIDKAFSWKTDFNMSFNRNKVLELDYNDVYQFGRIYSNNQDVVRLEVGRSFGAFYGYISEGVDPETGNIKYKDLNDNGILDSRDRDYIGNSQPDFIFGLTNAFNYKKWDLNIFFQGSYGNDIFNATRIDLEGMFDSKNQSSVVLRRWTPENTQTDIPRAIGGGKVDNVFNSTRFIEDGSYVRLKSLTFSYKIIDNSSKIRAIQQLKVFVTSENLLTFTRYSGFDPEVNAFGNSAVELGIDYGTYPQARTFLAGVNVEF